MLKHIFILYITTFTLYAQEDAGHLYLKNGCSACHGIYGEGIGATPRLQGKRKEVLIKRLKELKRGKTKSAFGTIMVSFAQSLDEIQIEQMAEYLSALKKTEPTERYDPEYDNAGDGSS